MDKKLRQSILSSFIFGAPLTIISIGCCIWFHTILSDSDIISFSIFGKKSLLAFLLALFVAFWFGGIIAYKSIKRGNSLLFSSFIYSFFVNFVLLLAFVLSFQLIATKNSFIKIVPSCISFIISTVLSAMTFGLLVNYLVKRLFLDQLKKN